LIEPLPSGWVNWIKPFWRVPDTFILNHGSLDGFFFLRYLRVLAIICFTGCILVWPVLLTLNGTGGRALAELELLTIGNIVNPYKFYAHALVSWLFFGEALVKGFAGYH
jgi:calcium permeable stress-gated cation channel